MRIFGSERRRPSLDRTPSSRRNWPSGRRHRGAGQQVGQPGPLPYADINDPQTLNKYAHVRNNPLRYTDPDGHIIDELADAAFILYDIRQIVKGGGATTTNVLALGADVVGAALPFVTGLGAAVRAEHAVEAGVHAGEAGVRAAEAGVHAEEAGKIAVAPYKRPSGATTAEQRAAVQGKPCVDCGQVAPRMNADHKTPLVKEHYQRGTIDKTRMRQKDALQPQCPTCSNRQGADLSRYSREQRKRLEEERLREQR